MCGNPMPREETIREDARVTVKDGDITAETRVLDDGFSQQRFMTATEAGRPSGRPSQVGSVVFDDKRHTSGGCASISGQVSRHIGSVDELSADTLWWTNITPASFLAETETEAWRGRHLRHDGFPVIDRDAAARDLGCNLTTLNRMSELCAALFVRAQTSDAGKCGMSISPKGAAPEMKTDMDFLSQPVNFLSYRTARPLPIVV